MRCFSWAHGIISVKNLCVERRDLKNHLFYYVKSHKINPTWSGSCLLKMLSSPLPNLPPSQEGGKEGKCHKKGQAHTLQGPGSRRHSFIWSVWAWRLAPEEEEAQAFKPSVLCFSLLPTDGVRQGKRLLPGQAPLCSLSRQTGRWSHRKPRASVKQEGKCRCYCI